jgi:hypothetical protein
MDIDEGWQFDTVRLSRWANRHAWRHPASLRVYLLRYDAAGRTAPTICPCRLTLPPDLAA